MGWSVLHDDYDEVVYYIYTKRAYQEKVDEIWRWFNSTEFMCIGSWFLRQGLFEASFLPVFYRRPLAGVDEKTGQVLVQVSEKYFRPTEVQFVT